MRLGGSVFEPYQDPDSWVSALKKLGYGAAYCPELRGGSAGDYAAAAKKAGIVIAEVGAWSNPLHPDPLKRREARELCQKQLALAEEIGARCCVNISGSRGERWDGPHPLNLTRETFEMVVAATREIIDAVKPTRTFYTLEPMPWMYPDSAESYLNLIRAIDRRSFGVHYDPVNLVCSPQHYYANGRIMRDFISRLGPHIRSCHAKDIRLGEKLTTHLDEVRPGLGELDYRAYLLGLKDLNPDLPLMIEHLETAEEFARAADYIRSVAAGVGVAIKA